MNCQGVQETLTALLDGELSPPESLEIEDHIVDCSACKSELEGLRRTHDLTARALRAGNDHSQREKGFDELWKAIEAPPARLSSVPGTGGQEQNLRPPSRGSRADARTAARFAWTRPVVRAVAAMAAAAAVALVLYSPSSRESSPDRPSRVTIAREAGSGGSSHRGAKSRSEPSVVAGAEGLRTNVLAKGEGATAGAGRQPLGADDLQVPDELRQRAGLFVDYPIVRRLDKLRSLEAVLSHPDDLADDKHKSS